MKNIIAVLMIAAVPVRALADEGPIAADRPGFSTGTYTVKPGRLHVELGYQNAFNNHGVNRSTQTLPLLGLRTGLSSKSEIDLLWDGWNIDTGENQSTDASVSDVSFGGKYRLHEGPNYHLTARGLLSLPLGSSPSTSDHVDPLLGLLWDDSPSSQVSLFGVVEANLAKVDGDSVYDAQVAIGASFSHTDRIGTFIEFFGVLPSKSTLDDEVVMDGGVTYLLSNDVQLDINAGVGLNHSSNDFWGFGVASRF